MVKNHQKRIATPKTWAVKRKETIFVTKASPGPLSKELSVPLTVFFKDMVDLASTTRDVKFMLYNKTVLVNDRQVKDYRFPVGFMDIITIKEDNINYRIKINKQGKLEAIEAKKGETQVLSKITNKTIVKGGRVQLNLLNGYNVLVEKDTYKTGDSVVLDGKAIKDHMKYEKGAYVLLTAGKHIGDMGTLEDIQDDKILYKNSENKVLETNREFAFVLGNKKSILTL